MGLLATPFPNENRQDTYYATPGQMGSPTRRLPGPTKKKRRTCQFPQKIPGTSEVHPEKWITPRIVGMGLEKN